MLTVDITLPDIEELHKFGLPEIRRAWVPLYALFDSFAAEGRLRKIVGNHDLATIERQLKAGSGPLDHIALAARGRDELVERCRRHGVEFFERTVPSSRNAKPECMASTMMAPSSTNNTSVLGFRLGTVPNSFRAMRRSHTHESSVGYTSDRVAVILIDKCMRWLR